MTEKDKKVIELDDSSFTRNLIESLFDGCRCLVNGSNVPNTACDVLGFIGDSCVHGVYMNGGTVLQLDCIDGVFWLKDFDRIKKRFESFATDGIGMDWIADNDGNGTARRVGVIFSWKD